MFLSDSNSFTTVVVKSLSLTKDLQPLNSYINMFLLPEVYCLVSKAVTPKIFMSNTCDFCSHDCP